MAGYLLEMAAVEASAPTCSDRAAQGSGPGGAIPPLRSATDYERALDACERYFDDPPQPGTSDAERFDALAQAIKTYEDARWPLEPE